MSITKVSTSRRKLLIASAAAPVVATLHSGAALAASSAVCRPLKDVSNKKFPDNGNSLFGDTAVRYSVPTYQKIGSSGVAGSKYIYDIDGQLYHHSGFPFDSDLNDYTRLPENEQAHVLMLYGTDSEGTYEVGLWPKFQVVYSGDGQFPISASCLTSIAVSGSGSFRGL